MGRSCELKKLNNAEKVTSPTGQRCVLIVSLRGVRLSKHANWLFNSLRDLTVAKNNREMRFLKRRNGPTDGWTDRPSYRDARTHLKRKSHELEWLDKAMITGGHLSSSHYSQCPWCVHSSYTDYLWLLTMWKIIFNSYLKDAPVVQGSFFFSRTWILSKNWFSRQFFFLSIILFSLYLIKVWNSKFSRVNVKMKRKYCPKCQRFSAIFFFKHGGRIKNVCENDSIFSSSFFIFEGRTEGRIFFSISFNE